MGVGTLYEEAGRAWSSARGAVRRTMCTRRRRE